MKFVLAPLAGFTDAPFRRLCFEGGCDLAVTEMVSAPGLAYGSSPTRHLLEVMPGEGPVACQLFGAREEDLAKAAAIIEREAGGRFVALDLNAGCPMTKVTKCGAGAELVKSPDKIGRLVKAMKENTSLPITVKTRLGPRPGEITIFEIADAAAANGATALTVHARFTSQMHGGTVHYDILKEVVQKSKLPITGNGSVVNLEGVRRMAECGVESVMIGRAALANPGIFNELKGVAVDAETKSGYVEHHLEYLLAFRRQLCERFPLDHIPSEDGFASVKMHTHLFRYFNGRPGAAALRARLNSVRTLAEIFDIIHNYGHGRIS